LSTQFDTIRSKLPGSRSSDVELLEVALDEAHVRARVAVLLAVVLDVALGDRELLVGHVDADDRAALADEPRQHEAVLPGTRAEVEHRQALEQVGRDQAAAVVADETSGWIRASSGFTCSGTLSTVQHASVARSEVLVSCLP
jgi:hypothetical protein